MGQFFTAADWEIAILEQSGHLWPADKVERRRVADLVPYARNARTHNEQQVAQVAASIREWGWTIPILIDEEGGIIAGHCRVMAANKLKIDEVPCMTAKGWTEAQKRAYVLADNKLALNAGWDEATLAVELQDIQALGFDQLLTGFSENEIKALSENGEPAIGDPDEIPNTLDIPVTRLGDKWTLGKHVMLCGDSTDKKSVSRLIGNKRAHICLTDPPYGIGETKSIKNKYDIHDDTVENLRSVISGFLPIAQTISDVVVLTPGNGNVHKYPEPKWTMAWFTPAGVGRGRGGSAVGNQSFAMEATLS